MARNPLSILDFYSGETSFATEFRRILFNIESGAKDRGLKSFLVTSSTLSEGKSTISSMLAITASRKDIKTLLIDADLRRPSIHKMFLTERAKGLTEILTENSPAKTVTRATMLENLDLITAGRAVAEPSEVFDATAIGRVIEEAKFYYDLIILDSAPIIPVSDPMLLAREVDGIVMVVRAGKTQKEVVKRATDIIRSDNAPVLGVVLNNVTAALPYYYDERYYGYHYNTKPPTNSLSGHSPLNKKLLPEQDQPSPSGKKGDRSGKSDTGKITHRK